MISTAFAFGQRRGVLCKLSGIQELVYPSFSSIHVELFYVRPLTLEELKQLFLSLRSGIFVVFRKNVHKVNAFCNVILGNTIDAADSIHRRSAPQKNGYGLVLAVCVCTADFDFIAVAEIAVDYIFKVDYYDFVFVSEELA